VDVAGLITIPGGESAGDRSTEGIRGVVIVVVLAEGADLRGICTAMKGMFASIADKDGVMLEVGRRGAVEKGGAAVIRRIEGEGPTVRGPVLGREGTQRGGRLEDGEFTEPVSVGGHASKADCFLHFGGCDARQRLRSAEERREMPREAVSGGGTEEGDELASPISDFPHSAVAEAYALLCRVEGAE
jgi:hypothetical protein